MLYLPEADKEDHGPRVRVDMAELMPEIWIQETGTVAAGRLGQGGVWSQT